MNGVHLLRGLLIGLAVAAPIGPNGVLCIRRTLAGGRRAGLASGLGAATVHAFYAAVAASGLTLLAHVPPGPGLGLRALGAGFLCYLGLRVFRTHAPAASGGRAEGLPAIYASTVLLTCTNPLTILSFSALFAGFGPATDGGAAASPLVLGVALGSAGWWCALSTGTSLLRAFVTAPRLRWVNRLSGTAILAFGLLALARLAP